MITLKFPIHLADEDQQFIKELQQQQSPIIRSAYKQSTYGLAEISVRSEIRTRFDKQLDSWFQQSAIKSGMGMFKSDFETKRTSRIFGGKKNFIKRLTGRITNEEWKDLRLLPLYLIGEAPQRGNRKFSFENDHVIFKPWRDKKITINLPKMNKNWSNLWSGAVIMAYNQALPITVSLKSNFICLTFDDAKVKETIKSIPSAIKNRYAGIDLNPNFIGISVFDKDRLVETKLFSISELTGKNKNENKISHETHEIGIVVGQWLKHLRVDKVFVEQLNFKTESLGKGRNLNRLCKNQWKKSKFISSLKKFYPKLYEINAAYTSTIGNVLNPTLPDPIAASTAIAKRGYELVIKRSKQFYPVVPTLKYLEDLWKETTIPVFTTWKELHDWIKNTGMKYRVPIPSRKVFRIFSSPRSLVGVL